VEIATIGFTQHTAESFFGRLRTARIEQLIDVRINNVSQLAGFAKRDDLRFFLRELCDASYVHETLLAPTDTLLKEYRDKRISWTEYEKRFLGLMEERAIEDRVPRELFAKRSALLCSEHTPEKCHRRLVADYLGEHWGNLTVVHL
jgi:uncharacterized protein (DUF488 family)